MCRGRFGGVRGGLARNTAQWERPLWLMHVATALLARSDRLDYWLTQARLWVAEVVRGPEP